MDWLTSYTNALGKTTEYTYDLEGNLTSRKDAAGRTEQFDYDESGKLTEYTAPSGKKISYDYDELNELIKKSYETAKGKKADDDVLYAYDAAGQRVSMTDAIGAAAYEYDALGRVTKAKDSAGQTVTYAYSESGNQQEMGYPDGTKVTYEYDSAGNRTAYEKVTESETVEKYSYKYNDSNQLISKTEKTDWRFWKHVKTTYEYDEDSNRLFTLDYVEDGNKSQKGQVLIPNKKQEEYYSITQ